MTDSTPPTDPDPDVADSSREEPVFDANKIAKAISRHDRPPPVVPYEQQPISYIKACPRMWRGQMCAHIRGHRGNHTSLDRMAAWSDRMIDEEVAASGAAVLRDHMRSEKRGSASWGPSGPVHAPDCDMDDDCSCEAQEALNEKREVAQGWSRVFRRAKNWGPGRTALSGRWGVLRPAPEMPNTAVLAMGCPRTGCTGVMYTSVVGTSPDDARRRLTPPEVFACRNLVGAPTRLDEQTAGCWVVIENPILEGFNELPGELAKEEERGDKMPTVQSWTEQIDGLSSRVSELEDELAAARSESGEARAMIRHSAIERTAGVATIRLLRAQLADAEAALVSEIRMLESLRLLNMKDCDCPRGGE